MALLHLAQGETLSEAARRVCAARSTVQQWRGLYEEFGEAGLEPAAPGRSPWTVTDAVLERMRELLENSPEFYGYLRATWSSELLALELGRQLNIVIHPSTVRRALPGLGYVWRRARPILVRRDPGKNRKMRAIRRALRSQLGRETFYVDEADIDLNPKIGAVWSRRGQQVGIPTPGQNVKHYVAGALHAHTGKLVWVEHQSKNSTLFIKLLEALRSTYRAAHQITLILDNYIIHKCEATEQWLSKNKKFRMVFQPTYSPWVNQIERLWKAMHDTVTRNHRCATFYDLAQRIVRFFTVVQPFPGNQHALATLKL
jgi:transposase